MLFQLLINGGVGWLTSMLLSAETGAKAFFLFTSCTKAVIVSQLKGGRGNGKKMLNMLKAKQANRHQTEAAGAQAGVAGRAQEADWLKQKVQFEGKQKGRKQRSRIRDGNQTHDNLVLNQCSFQKSNFCLQIKIVVENFGIWGDGENDKAESVGNKRAGAELENTNVLWNLSSRVSICLVWHQELNICSWFQWDWFMKLVSHVTK